MPANTGPTLIQAPLPGRMMHRLRWSLLCVCTALQLFLLSGCTSTSPALTSAGSLYQPSTIPDAQVLLLDAEFKAVLDERVKPVRYAEDRVQALHDLLFYGTGYGYGLSYQGHYTRTAIETLNSGGGNCVSLANIFVAAARYVGLDAKFQEGRVPEDWQGLDSHYVIPGHVNVLIRINSRHLLTVEFLGAYQGREVETRTLSDQEALAHYYSNLGMKQLGKGDLLLAENYLRKSRETYDESASVWSNMGVIQRRLEHFDEAEYAYLKALQYDADYITAKKNLYILYAHLGETTLAQKYAAEVEEYNRRNPYYLYMLATGALHHERYGEALHLLERAIAIKPTEDRFHFALAKTYFLSGDLKHSAEAMRTARKMAGTPADRRRYQAKLAALAAVAES